LPSIAAIFSGIFINKFGPKYSLLAGCVGYPLKVAAYLCYEYTQNTGFIAFAGVVLTICQGVSGSVVPYLMLAYPTQNYKGRAVAWFLGLWSLCALIGALASICTGCVRLVEAPSDIGDRSHFHRLLRRRNWAIHLGSLVA
jgi:MFS family permease